MRILLCIDDTDNMDSKGTGELAENIAQAIEEYGWGKTKGVTRHQLLVHEDIPYTSHNSSMCFEGDIDEKYLENIIDYASEFLENESAPGSDPGLCVVVLDDLKDSERLISFGKSAKEVVLKKNKAYTLAKSLDIHLSEHGGTGQGIIGALAGTGLRLSGKDGRFKGKLKMNGIIKVKDLCLHKKIDMVRSLDGRDLDEEEMVLLEDKVKTVLLEGKSILLVSPNELNDKVHWKNCSKQELRSY